MKFIIGYWNHPQEGPHGDNDCFGNHLTKEVEAVDAKGALKRAYRMPNLRLRHIIPASHCFNCGKNFFAAQDHPATSEQKWACPHCLYNDNVRLKKELGELRKNRFKSLQTVFDLLPYAALATFDEDGRWCYQNSDGIPVSVEEVATRVLEEAGAEVANAYPDNARRVFTRTPDGVKPLLFQSDT